MAWRYIAARQTVNGGHQWTIRELHIDGDKVSWSAEPSYPSGEDRAELLGDLSMMDDDANDGPWLDLDTGEYHDKGTTHE